LSNQHWRPPLAVILALPLLAGTQTLAQTGGAASQVSKTGVETAQVKTHPLQHHLIRAHSFDGDVRHLPQAGPRKFERPEIGEEPELHPEMVPGTFSPEQTASAMTQSIGRNAPAPSPSASFEGLDFATWGAGHPPDTDGDVGPNYFIQAVNTSIGIYNKSDGSRVAAFTFDTFMSQGHFGNLCDTDNFGDPVVLYDTFEDRWIITDFAFQLDASGNVKNPPGQYQCFAVSKSGDPVSGGWNYYSIFVQGGLGDYPKFGIWPDGLYMSANVFGYAASGSFQNVRVWALNKAQMYAGATNIQAISFDAPSAEFTLLPSNARLQTGAPPAGSPNYFATVGFTNALTVYKFHADWNSVGNSTFTGPFLSGTSTAFATFSPTTGTVPSPKNALDTLYPRLMMQNQYSNLGGVESLWNSHTVGATGTSSTQAALRYYQVKVTGGTVETNATQAFTYSPDTTVHRFMPSVAVDRAGDMAIGYTATSSTLNPAVRYAARLAGDPVNSISQTEQSLIEGAGSQTGNCGTAACTRWGDYSTMTLDPDGCTFWFTTEYYADNSLNNHTRIGSFSLPNCTKVGTGGTIQGAITASAGGAPIAGATVSLGSRITTTAADGTYSFAGLPAGTYPTLTVSYPGLVTRSASNISVTDGGATEEDFALDAAPTSGCLTDTTQADFQAGTSTACDLASSPGDVTLLNAPNIDQQNTNLSTSGQGVTTTGWQGQTFTAGVSGQITRIDLNLFCSSCTGTSPNLTVSIRNTASNLPTGTDLATATIAGNNSGAGGFWTANFASPLTVTAGTVYAVLVRPVSNPSAGTYAATTSTASTYAGGRRVSSTNSGGAWTGGTNDIGFVIYVQSGFAPSGTFISSLKDANPAPGATPHWGAISWNAVTPGATAIAFQAAAANSPTASFSFVGPDGTANTFFTNGASLAQFNGNRYLRYSAKLTTTSGSTTPTLNDVTVCFNDNDLQPSALTLTAPSGTFGGSLALSAMLTGGGSGLSGRAVHFTVNGVDVGSAVTDAAGFATLSSVSLAGIHAGSYPNAVTATFAGDAQFAASTDSQALTVGKAAQTIAFNQPADQLANAAPFTLSASASSGNPVVFSTTSSACSVSGATVTLLGAGSCSINADQAGSVDYDAAPTVTKSFNVTKVAQSITFAAIQGFSWSGGSAALSASASSGLAVSFGVASGPCSVSSGTVTATGAGSCVITADQAGDARYTAAAQATQPVTATKATQTILFAAIGDHLAIDPPFSLIATGGGSNNPVVFTTLSTACSVSANVVSLLTLGPCSIDADQAGDANYNAAAQVTRSFNVTAAQQTITFPPVTPFAWKDGSATLAAFSDSGLEVTYSVLSGPCQLAGSTLTATGAGTCVVAADQAGDAHYGAAAEVTATVDVAKAPQTLTIDTIGDKFATDVDFALTATSGGSTSGIVFAGTTDAVCTVDAGTVSLVTAGTCTVTADQAGDDDYDAAPQATQSFQVRLTPQLITFPTPASFPWNGGSATVAASASSGLPVTYTLRSGPCTLAGTTLTATAAGSCVVTADQAGSTKYAVAVQASVTVIATGASQVITFPEIASFSWSGGSATLAATSTSGLSVSYSVLSGPCVVSGDTLTGVGAGSCSVAADQAGDGNFSAAARVTNTVTVSKASQGIVFGALADHVATDEPFTLGATGGGSGNAVTFVSSSAACSVSGGTVTLNGAGTCTITASQAGNNDYDAAPDTSRSFNVSLATQTVSFAAISSFGFHGSTALSANASSGLPVTFTVLSGPCSVSGATLSASQAGTCTIAANQGGNAKYSGAPQAQQSVTVTGDDTSGGGGGGCSSANNTGVMFNLVALAAAGLLGRRRRKLN
jgi:hypothetical protein